MIFEHIISAIAPLACKGCETEGNILCSQCRQKLPTSKVCVEHLNGLAVIAATTYTDVAKDLVYALKFERTRAAAQSMALVMHERHVIPDGQCIVTFAPTAAVRVRQRGYDQACLLAKQLAHRQSLPYLPLLARISDTRQVGADKQERMQQAYDMFRIRNKACVQNATIVLVDDVITTGATMQAAANVLLAAGAQKVYAAAFAHAE